jgi:hypothetical protein
MTNTAQPTRSINDREVTMYQLPGHTLVRATIGASFVIENDYLVDPFGDVMSDRVYGVDIETPFIARFTLCDGREVRRFASINDKDELQVTVLRNVPLVD